MENIWIDIAQDSTINKSARACANTLWSMVSAVDSLNGAKEMFEDVARGEDNPFSEQYNKYINSINNMVADIESDIKIMTERYNEALYEE